MAQAVTQAVMAQQQNPLQKVGAFFWGDNGEMLTPAQAAAQAQLANSIIGSAPVPHTIGEGLSAVGRAMTARKLQDSSSAAIDAGTKQATTDLQTVLSDPTKAASFLSNDQYATEAQKAVAQAILSQQMMLTNPDMIAQRANLASETAKNTAEAGMFANGGAAVGAPVQLSDGTWGVQTQYGGVRTTGPGNAPGTVDLPPSAPQAAPADGSAPAPTQLMTDPSAPAAPVPVAQPPAGPAHILSPAELEQRKAVSTGLATDLLKTRDDAKAANDLQQYVQEGRQLINQPSITGAGAEWKIAATKWASTLGIKIPQDAANNSDAFKAVMGQAVGQIIKQFGSGTGLSDADRQYAQNIAGGNVELNKDAINRILDIAERNAQSRIDQYQQQVDAYNTGDTSKMLALPTPTGSLEAAPPAAPAATAPIFAINPQTGQRLQLVNGNWAPVQ